MSSGDPITMSSDGGRRSVIAVPAWATLLVMGLAAWAVFGWSGEAGRWWRSLLVNFIFFTPLAAGLVIWSAVLLVTRSGWHGSLESRALAGLAFALPSLLALALLWSGNAAAGPRPAPTSPAQGAWLAPNALFPRDLVALLAFWILAGRYVRQRAQGRGTTLGGVLILVYSLVFSLLAFDLVMALDPKWTSALFGGYFFMSGLYIAVTAWTWMAAWQRNPNPDQLHDLGRLIVTFSIITVYMMYSQLLPIWYENLPGEVPFVIPRLLPGSWTLVGASVLAVVYLGPLVMLLTIRAKRTPWIIGTIATVVLAGLWVERWWLVAPTFDPSPRLGVPELAVAAAFAGALGLGMSTFRPWLSPPAATEANS